MIQAKSKERQKGGQGGVLLSQESSEAKGETCFVPQESSEQNYRKNETHNQLAKLADVSHDTYKKGKIFLEKAPPELVKEVREGKKEYALLGRGNLPGFLRNHGKFKRLKPKTGALTVYSAFSMTE